MFENKHFEGWLDQMVDKVMKKMGSEKAISSEDMLVIVLKNQANHFSHLDTDLRSEMKNLHQGMEERFAVVDQRFVESREEMKNLREDMDQRFAESREDMKNLREDMEKRFAESREDMNRRLEESREDMNRRLEESREDMNRRFEAVDKRFVESREDMNRRFAESREDMKLLREDTNRRFVSTQWLIGIGITLMGVLMSLYQFLQQPPA